MLPYMTDGCVDVSSLKKRRHQDYNSQLMSERNLHYYSSSNINEINNNENILESSVINFSGIMSNKLCELSRQAFREQRNSFAPWHKVEDWLEENKRKRKLLKQAANYKHWEYGFTALHWLASSDSPPSHLVEKILKTSPGAAKVKNDEGELPLHCACWSEFHHGNNVSPDVIRMLLDAYPEAVQVKDESGWLPLHRSGFSSSSPAVVKMLLEVYPKGTEVKCNFGKLPLHHACITPNRSVMKLIYKAYPEAARVQDGEGKLPLHIACEFSMGFRSLEAMDLLLSNYPNGIDVEDDNGEKPSDYLEGPDSEFDDFYVHKAIKHGYSVKLVELLLRAFPDSCTKQDETGMIPLHIACNSEAPYFMSYVLALLEIEDNASLTIQDSQGRTPLQLLAHTLHRQDMNERLPLHRLAANSNNLCPKSLQLLVDAYPESIISVDKYGMLPFHYACMNPHSSIEVLMLFIKFSPDVALLSTIGSTTKFNELCELCRQAFCSRYFSAAPWNKVNRWLENNKRKRKLLKQAANYKHWEYGFTALHWLVSSDSPPSSLIEKILKILPDSAQVINDEGELPLHCACWSEFHHDNNVSPEVVRMLLDAYPEAAQIKDKGGELPLHRSGFSSSSPAVMKMLLEAYPKATEVKCNGGKLPLHHACNTPSPSVMKLIYEAYPEAARVQDDEGKLPLHIACEFSLGIYSLEAIDLLLTKYPNSIDVEDDYGDVPSDYLKDTGSKFDDCHVHKAIKHGLSVKLVELLLRAFPESCTKQDENDMIPLHIACSSKAPYFMSYVLALLEIEDNESLTIQDSQGRTPLQLLAHTSHRQDMNERLPLHRLAANSNNLCPKSLQLLADAYPASIKSVDKYGMLPFHYACLNPTSSIEVLMLFIKLSPNVVHFVARSSLQQKRKREKCCKQKRPQRKKK